MSRRLLSAVSAALVVAGGPVVLVAGATVAHAATSPVPYLLDDSLDVSAQSRMVAANGLLFVSQGNTGDPDVFVFDEDGNQIADIDDMPGAAGMVVSADGSTVYVALNNDSAISAIDTTTLTESGRISVAGCPENLALAAGRLFYSYGCQPVQDTSAVASVDLAHPAVAPVVALTRTYSPDLLAGAGNHLAVGDVGISPSTITAYDAGAGDGTLVSLGVDRSTDSNLMDLAMTPDGSQVVTASGSPYRLTEFAAVGMTQTHAFAGVAYPHAVAISPDGKDIAGGYDSYGDTVNLYDTTTTATLWQRAASPGPDIDGSWPLPFDAVLPGALTFSSDGSKVFGLVQAQNGGVGMFASVLAPAATNLRASAPTVTTGTPVTLTVSTGVANEWVDVVATPQGGTDTYLGGLVTGSDGTVSAQFRANVGGTLRLFYYGDDATLPSIITTTYGFRAAPALLGSPSAAAAPTLPSMTMPTLGSGGASLSLIPIEAAQQAKSSITAVMTGSMSRRTGIYRYRTLGSIRSAVTVTPAASRPTVSGTLQAYVKKHWVSLSTFKARSDATGKLTAKVTKAPAKTPLRIVFKVVADSHVKTSTTTSKTFELGS